MVPAALQFFLLLLFWLTLYETDNLLKTESLRMFLPIVSSSLRLFHNRTKTTVAQPAERLIVERDVAGRFPGLDQNSQLPLNGQVCEMDSSLRWTLLWNGRFCEMDTSVRWTLLWDGHLCKMDTSVGWTPLWDGHLDCPPLFTNFSWLSIRRTNSAGPKSFRLKESWLYLGS